MVKKKRQHYVWRRYLKPWTHEGRVACLMDGRVFQAGLMAVAQEKYFYRLKELSSAEIEFLYKIIGQIKSDTARAINERWLSLFELVNRIRTEFGNAGNHEVEQVIDEIICNFEEDLHCVVENIGAGYLDRMYERDLSFWDEDSLPQFLYFLALQYFRTESMQSNVVGAIGNFKNFNIHSMWAVLRHVAATQLSHGLYHARTRLKPALLENATTIPLITGDQPIINLAAVGHPQNEELTRLELYYPLTPTLAFLLSDGENPDCGLQTNLTVSDIDRLNKAIINQSSRQVYASDERILRAYIDSAT